MISAAPRLDAALAVEFPTAHAQLELLPLMPGVTIGYAREEKLGLDDWLRHCPNCICASLRVRTGLLSCVGRLPSCCPTPFVPATAPASATFTDHIARPSSGYRALQTTGQWPREAETRLVRCHTSSPREYARPSMSGVMSAAANDDGARPWPVALAERVSNSLKQRGDGDVGDYLRRHDFDDDPEPTYCFTLWGRSSCWIAAACRSISPIASTPSWVIRRRALTSTAARPT